MARDQGSVAGRGALPAAAHLVGEALLMRVLLVHPSALMYSEIFLRLEPLGLLRVDSVLLARGPDGRRIGLRCEPLGLERVASAWLADGQDVRLIDLQVYAQADLRRAVTDFRPEAVG